MILDWTFYLLFPFHYYSLDHTWHQRTISRGFSFGCNLMSWSVIKLTPCDEDRGGENRTSFYLYLVFVFVFVWPSVEYCKKKKCLRVSLSEYLVKDDPNFDPASNYHICGEKHTIKICHVHPNCSTSCKDWNSSSRLISPLLANWIITRCSCLRFKFRFKI